MRNRAISIYTTFGASGFSLGLVLCGLLTEVGWRWTLLVPAPVALLTLFAAIRLIPRGERAPRSGRHTTCPARSPSPAGCCCWSTPSSPRSRRLGLGPDDRLVRGGGRRCSPRSSPIERRSAHPLVRLGIFRSGALTRANIGAMALFGSYVWFQFIVTLYLQTPAGLVARCRPRSRSCRPGWWWRSCPPG